LAAPAEPTAHRRPSPSPCSPPAANAAEHRTHSSESHSSCSQALCPSWTPNRTSSPSHGTHQEGAGAPPSYAHSPDPPSPSQTDSLCDPTQSPSPRAHSSTETTAFPLCTSETETSRSLLSPAL